MIIKQNRQKEDWHTWYAWRPVHAYAGKDSKDRTIYAWVWLEYIKRKLYEGYEGRYWCYQTLPSFLENKICGEEQ
jgi:hypothetical protein